MEKNKAKFIYCCVAQPYNRKLFCLNAGEWTERNLLNDFTPGGGEGMSVYFLQHVRVKMTANIITVEAKISFLS